MVSAGIYKHLFLLEGTVLVNLAQVDFERAECGMGENGRWIIPFGETTV